jgi:phasin family protein
MEQLSKELMAMSKANLDTAIRVGGISLDSAERMLKVQLETAKEALAGGAQQAKSLANTMDWQGLRELANPFAQPNLEQMTNYFRAVCQVASLAQAETIHVIEEELAESNQRAQSTLDHLTNIAPAGSEVTWAAAKAVLSAGKLACDNALRSAKQFADMAKAHGDAGAERTTHETKRKQIGRAHV